MLNTGKTLYKNHLGETFEFGDDTGVYIGESELFNYKRSYESSSATPYQTISVKPKAMSVNVLFNGDVPKNRSKFFEVVDVDAEAGIPGTLRFGEYYMNGVFVESSNSAWQYGYGEMIRKMTFLSDNPIWQRDIVKVFDADDTRAAIINESYRPSPMTIEVFGSSQTTTASVTIGGNVYEVNKAVPEGSVLVIDGIAKTATLIDSSGNETNVLDYRVGSQVKGSGEYLFEELPSGYNQITSRTHGRLRITVHEQRLEVKFK